MPETKFLEWKEKVSPSFLKTVSAFANYGTGSIIFGINDEGFTIGIDNLKETSLAIENAINDNLSPRPEFSIFRDETQKTIQLKVYEGKHKPYLYKGKAYQRQDTSSIEVDRTALKALVMEGVDVMFEDQVALHQNLSFDILSKWLKDEIGVDLNENILKTLGLYEEGKGFNRAAELLADRNDEPGIEIVRFGKSIDIIQQRYSYQNCSILNLYQWTLEKFREFYSYEKIESALREEVYRIPEVAFREALANALIHRSWDVNASVNISFFSDRVEIVSPGGLPEKIVEASVLKGGLSILKNPKIGTVFVRLHIIEQFGTGIPRIKRAYEGCKRQPQFTFFPTSIHVTLPVVDKEVVLSDEEGKIYQLLRNGEQSSGSLMKQLSFGKNKTLNILSRLELLGMVERIGQGRSTKYRVLLEED